MCRQLVDDRPGQSMLTHVVKRRVVDHVVGVTGTQQVEEVQATLAASGAEPGEAVVADLRADGVGAAVAGTGVVDRDPGCRLQTGAQHRAGLRQEVVLPVDQQAHDPGLRRGRLWRLEMLTPNACNCVSRRSTVTPAFAGAGSAPGGTASARGGAVPARNGHGCRLAAAPRWSRPPVSASA